MLVRFLDVAVVEWGEGIGFYNGKSEGLGVRFGKEVRRTIARIKQFPQAWTLVGRRVRRCLVKQFPWVFITTLKTIAL